GGDVRFHFDFVHATPNIEDVSDTQNARTVLIVSGAWSRQRRSTISKTQSNTLRNTSASVITTMKASASLANGLALVLNGSGCPGKSAPMISCGCAKIEIPRQARRSRSD